MTFRSGAEPHLLYRAGKHDEALALAAQVTAANPYAVEAQMTAALIQFRRNAVPETLERLKACLVSRSAEWVLERLRQDLLAFGRSPLRKDMGFRMGALLRSSLGPLGPALPPEQRVANHEFMNVVGTSYVRSFGGSPAFFPLFIGMGPTMLLLTEDLAAVTRRKFKENLKRVDPTRNTMLVVGGDPYYHVVDLHQAGATRPDGPTAEDLAIMDRVAERHAGILDDAREMITGKLMLLGLTPTMSDLMNPLCRRLNQRLKTLCAAKGVIFLDWWDELADPSTDRLKAEYSANAYPGDVHFSLATTRRFMELLKQDGLFSAAVTPASDYQWSHVFECAVDASEKTRIWCEPSVTPRNAFQSHKVASSHLSALVADLLTTLGADQPDQTFLMMNVRDAYLPVSLPAQVHVGCRAFTDTPDNLRVGQQVLDFYGRRDVRLGLSDDLSDLDGPGFSQMVLLIHPDTAEADEARCNAALARLHVAPSIVVGTPFPERLGALNLGQRKINLFGISNRHIPEQWRDYTVAVVI